MKKITKKRKKEILHKYQEDMTVFEVLFAVPLGVSENMTSIINPSSFLRSFENKPFSRRKMDNMFHKELTDNERLLISAQIKLISERLYLVGDLIENQLIER